MEAKHNQTVQSITKATHDVLHIVVEKPANYSFMPGQATEVAIDKPAWNGENRPFSFTSLPGDDFIEFTIKTYPSHKGMTDQLNHLAVGEKLILHDVWGAINYAGEGLFIAGGAGVTPFLSILRHLDKEKKIGNNKLVFANKTVADIICHDELKGYLAHNFINVLSGEAVDSHHYGYVSEEILKEHISGGDQKFYICGPPPFMEAVQKIFERLGVGDTAVVMEV